MAGALRGGRPSGGGELLITPDFSLPLIVYTDASKLGLGGILSQIRAGEEHPEECGNPFPTPRVRGVVVEGVYRRYPPALGEGEAGVPS